MKISEEHFKEFNHVRADKIESKLYFVKVLNNVLPNDFPHLTGPISRNLKDAVQATKSFYLSSEAPDRVIQNRRKLTRLIERFHKEARTLTPSVRQSIDQLKQDDVLVIESAHQPNLFPYSRMVRKIVLSHAISSNLKKEVRNPVIVLFGVVDQDFANRKYFRRTALPDPSSKDGTLYLRVPVNKDDTRVMYLVEKPTSEIVNCWKRSMGNWYRLTVKALNRLSQEMFDEVLITKALRRRYLPGLRDISELIDESYGDCKSFTEFNAFFMSKLINEAWEFPTLFYEYHTSERIFSYEFKWLLNQRANYVSSLNKHWDFLTNNGVELDFPKVEIEHVPFWLHCDCGRKIAVYFDETGEMLKGKCKSCKKIVDFQIRKGDEYDLSQIISRISSRAIARDFVSFMGLGTSIYITGLGAIGFNMVGRGIGNDLELRFPPCVVWPARDLYLGLSQALSYLCINKASRKRYAPFEIETKSDIIRKEMARKYGELKAGETRKETKRFIKSLKDADRALSALNLMPSIIDYLINIGQDNLRRQWISFLKHKGVLTENILLNTLLWKHEAESPWPSRLWHSTCNREVVGSNPTGDSTS